MAAPPLIIFYPNGGTSAAQMYIWDGAKPILWDGSVSVSVTTSGTAIEDGVSAAIKATVLDLTNSNPLTVGIVDSNGDQISSFGGGTQYTDGASTVAHPVGTMPVYDNAGAISKVGMSNGLPVQIRASNNTQAISAASLPLPTGASTETTLAAIKAKTDNIDVALSTRTKPADAQHAIIDSGTVVATNGKTIKTASGSFTSDTDVIAAVSSKRIKVIAYSFLTFGTSATTILLKSNGTGGTELWRVIVQAITGTIAGANLAMPAPSFIFATVAGEKLTADTNTGDTVHYSISYFDDDAT